MSARSVLSRAAAVVAAAAMVVVAFAVRGGDDPAGEAATELICPADLVACTAAGARSAPISATFETLATAPVADLAGEAWLLPRPVAEAALAEREFRGLDAGPRIVGEPLVTTGVVLALWEDVGDAAILDCGDQSWPCLAERPGLRIAAPPIDATAGLAVALSQAASLLGRADFATNDMDADVAFASGAAALGSNQITDPLTRMRTRGPGAVSAVGVLAVDATATTSSFGAIRIVPPDVPVDVDLVLVAAGDGPDEALVRRVTESLIDAGWTVGGTSTPMPRGSVLAELRARWKDL